MVVPSRFELFLSQAYVGFCQIVGCGDDGSLLLILFNYHIIRYVHFRDFKQKIYNKIKIAKIVKLLD